MNLMLYFSLESDFPKLVKVRVASMDGSSWKAHVYIETSVSELWARAFSPPFSHQKLPAYSKELRFLPIVLPYHLPLVGLLRTSSYSHASYTQRPNPGGLPEF